MENYEYNVVEKSLTQDFMIKWVWKPFVNILPKGVTPNMLTYLGLVFVATMVVGTWLAALGHKWGLLLTAASTFLYMLCDNSDGILARTTGQTSRLGEFLDHWLDSISFVLVNACIAYSLGFTGSLLFVYVAMMTLAFYVTMWEHHYTGIFFSGHIGSNESMLIYIISYILLFFFPQASWLAHNESSWYSVASVLFVMAVVGSAFTALGCLWRVKKHFVDVILFTLSFLAVGLWSYYGLLSSFWITILLTGINTIFCGKLVKLHLAKFPSPYRYKMVVVGLVVCFAQPFLPSLSFVTEICYGATALMIIAAVWDAVATISYLQK